MNAAQPTIKFTYEALDMSLPGSYQISMVIYTPHCIANQLTCIHISISPRYPHHQKTTEVRCICKKDADFESNATHILDYYRHISYLEIILHDAWDRIKCRTRASMRGPIDIHYHISPSKPTPQGHSQTELVHPLHRPQT